MNHGHRVVEQTAIPVYTGRVKPTIPSQWRFSSASVAYGTVFESLPAINKQVRAASPAGVREGGGPRSQKNSPCQGQQPTLQLRHKHKCLPLPKQKMLHAPICLMSDLLALCGCERNDRLRGQNASQCLKELPGWTRPTWITWELAP